MARPQTISDEQIIEAARCCFLEHGPQVATEVIAARLHVSPQALLKRFGSKQALMLAALKPPPRAPWIAYVESGPDDRPLEEQLTDVLNQVARFFLDVAGRIEVLRWSGINPRELLAEYSEPPPLVEIRMLQNWFQRAAARGLVREADFAAISLMLLTSLHGPTMLTELLGRHPTGHSADGYVERLVDLVLHGLLMGDNQGTESLLTGGNRKCSETN